MAAATYPTDRRYHEAHDWATLDGDVATFGITWHAQDSLGDIVYYAPPEIGQEITAGGSYGELESVKAVSDLIAPLAGEIVEVNDGVASSPEQVNDDPYGAWLVRVKVADTSAFTELLDSEAYQALLG